MWKKKPAESLWSVSLQNQRTDSSYIQCLLKDLEMSVLSILEAKLMPEKTTPWPLGVSSIIEPVKQGLAESKLDYGEKLFFNIQTIMC